MINKLLLESIIEKYYLDGLVESVKWKIKKDQLTISFISPLKDTAGTITVNNFPLPDNNIHIFNTSQLLKLINVTQGEVYLTTDNQKLYIADQQFNISYSLAEEFLIPKTPKIPLPEKPSVEVELELENITSLIKARKSIDNSNNLIIEIDEDDLLDENKLEFTFGDNSDYANKITYPMKATINEYFSSLLFNADVFRNVLTNNKDMNSGKILLYKDGLMKIEFTSDLINTEYYLIMQEKN